MRDFLLMLTIALVLLLLYRVNKNNKKKKALWSLVEISDVTTNTQQNKLSVNLQRMVHNKDFLLIYGAQSITLTVIISIGYYVFWCFVCDTLSFSSVTFILGTLGCILICYKVVSGIYAGKFSDYFEAQFPYALRSISRNLAVGQTIYVAISAAADNLTGIMQKEFIRISEQLKSGVSFDDILDRGETIYPYKGYYVFSAYLRVSIQKGSSLRETLMSLADDLLASQIIKKKTRALTSEARGAAKILACLPVIMLLVLYQFAKDNFVYLFTELYGRYVVIYVVISVTIGFLIIMKMIKGVQL